MESDAGNGSQGAHWQSFVLRLHVGADGRGDGQIVLVDPTTGARIGFASLENLFLFLMNWVATQAGESDPACQPCAWHG